MRVVQINAYCSRGSTGKICEGISKQLTERHIENYVIYNHGYSNYEKSIKISCGGLYTKIQSLKSRLYGNNGFNSKLLTQRLLSVLDQINPDVVHLHNLHAQNCNLEMLVGYLKKKGIRTFWTFHDCWMFTGYCMYYEITNCSKWKSKCGDCPQSKMYSWFRDKSNAIWERKKELFQDWDVIIVAPSEWLAQQIRESFLMDKDIKVIKNGVDLKVFNPQIGTFRLKYGLNDKKIVLGVADLWDDRKGFETMVTLPERLGPNYQVVLVGVDKKNIKSIPSTVIAIEHTESIDELIELYSTADIFVNPTIDEVFGLVNIESLACGTPVVMYNTGGSPECIDEKTGCVVPKYNQKELANKIIEICTNTVLSSSDCIKRAAQFDSAKTYKEYCDLYS